MKRLQRMSASVVALAAIAGSPALGADLPIKAPMAPIYAPPQFNWTGWYFGGNVGGGWTQGTVIDANTGGSFGAGNQGTFIGGGQAGFNYQVGNAVFGLEGFFDGIARNNNNASTFLTGVGGDLFQANAHATWVGTLAGRLGFEERMGVGVLDGLPGDLRVVREQLKESLTFEIVSAGDHEHPDLAGSIPGAERQ